MTTTTFETRPRPSEETFAFAGRPNLVIGNLVINWNTFIVSVNGSAVDLTRQEFDLLVELVERRDRVVPTEEICTALWEDPKPRYARRLATIVCRLRGKITDLCPYQLRCVRGRGYGFITTPGA